MIDLYSHRNTGDIEDGFIELGYTDTEAFELASNYINQNSFNLSYNEFIQQNPNIINNLGFNLPIDKPILGTDFGIFNELKSKNIEKIIRVSGMYEGIYYIKELENELFYIPESYYCLLNCYLYVLKNTGLNDLVINTKNIYPQGETIIKVLNKVKKKLLELNYTPEEIINILPPVYEIITSKDNDILEYEPIYTTENNIKYGSIYKIGILDFKGKISHAIVFKLGDYIYTKEDLKILDECFTTNLELKVECYKLTLPVPKKSTNIICVFDIETFIYTDYKRDKKTNQLLKNNKLIPIGSGLSIVDLKNKTWTDPEIFIRNKKLKQNDTDIYEQMIYRLNELLENNLIPNNLQIFSHNGSRFDNLYMLSVKDPEIKFKKIIQKGTQVKYLEVIYKNGTYIFKDSFSFLLMGLSNACKTFKCKNQKIELDIKNKSLEWFENNGEWIPYMEKDVICLAEVLCSVEPMYNSLGESITSNITLGGIGWSILTKSCFNMKYLIVPKYPTLTKFMSDSIYGGRVIHWKIVFNNKKQKDTLISIDFNSQYPSIMYSCGFPINSPLLLNEFELKNINIILSYPHFIIECDIIPTNTKYPLHPWKENKKSFICYKVEPFTGVYNDVDIREMLKDGYEIKKVHRGIFWKKSERIYTDIIREIYSKRKEYKEQKNPIEYILKIILNIMYGKHTEINNVNFNFDNPKEVMRTITKIIDLNNGQKKYKYKNSYVNVQKPIYIAGYILSYARRLVNEVIRYVGPENVWYGDTDSLFVLKSCIKDLPLNNELCGYKNDLGEGVEITFGIFLDIKRFIVKLNNNTSKIRYSGIDFRNIAGDKSNFKLLKEQEYKTVLNEIFKPLYYHPDTPINITVERWSRLNYMVIINEKEIKYTINRNKRGNWIKDEFYPFGYYHDAEEYIITNKSELGTLLKEEMKKPIKNYMFHTSNNINILNSFLLIPTDEENNQNVLLPSDTFNSNFIYLDNKYYRKIKQGKKNKWWLCNKYGITKEEYIILPDKEIKHYLLQCKRENTILKNR